ncbi:MAG: hypothetical protein MUO26_07555 [Methanotrichaceae archaeon]|nr:hypothetical protein [Methanotrichaceae archaeon]
MSLFKSNRILKKILPIAIMSILLVCMGSAQYDPQYGQQEPFQAQMGQVPMGQAEVGQAQLGQEQMGQAAGLGQMQTVPMDRVTLAPAIDLTGTYLGKPDGVYFIKQIGNQIYWLGEASSQNYPPFWANVAYGTKSGSTVNVNWADIPKGSTMNGGTATLGVSQQQGMTVLNVQQETGGFKTTQMIRFDSPGTGILVP